MILVLLGVLLSHLLGEHDLGGAQEGHAVRGEKVDAPAERGKDDVADGTRQEAWSASAGLKVMVQLVVGALAVGATTVIRVV